MMEPSTTSPEDPFAEIRPYSNLEAPAVMERLTQDAELAETVARWRFPRLHAALPGLATFPGSIGSKWPHTGCDGGRSANLIAPNLSRMIKRTSRFSVSGIDGLDLSLARVYLSNHRDIVMDPAYVNYALHRAGATTWRLPLVTICSPSLGLLI
ncbi:MAG: hypothetical protein CM15mP74_25880 [Halieaceae bacterium]|nr:MAG: hypothetical protein CM15mP74_25880 [Halieaceae bacterium]